MDITADYCIAGEYKGIPVSVAIGDNQASVFSTLADEGNILLNIGTGSQVSVISDKILIASAMAIHDFFIFYMFSFSSSSKLRSANFEAFSFLSFILIPKSSKIPKFMFIG